ncbi:unnamed protein product [Lepeophtheirus salmonis]|uniref:(salmon louse) hypothetical protein n=1 Tax=Lepeophtheirus salmonis TaxID=72036 RepID=A0A7R8CFU9_LEPSM|nr:unnamed protein product [Lepeophtheirus salmonis]CAF2809769.1 unnamed protein product [Lepeophtheirus salmonis]
MELISPVAFEPVGSVTNVFFDDKNQQVFSVRSGGATGIIVRGFSDDYHRIKKCLPFKERKNQVEFFKVLRTGLTGSIDEVHKFIQVSKGKSSTILGFFWTKDNEILFISESGLEVHFISNLDRGVIKNLRNQTFTMNWFVYSPSSSFLLCSSSSSTSSLQPFIIRNSHIVKVSKIDINQKEVLVKEKDVIIIEAFHKIFVGIFIHTPNNSSSLHLYSLSSKDTLNKSHILRLGRPGPFSTNVVDNVLVIHHQPTGTSLLFDPSMPGESDGTLIHMDPITNTPVCIKSGDNCDMDGQYPLQWAAFQPDLIVDGKEGKFWRLKLRIKPFIIDNIPDLRKKIEFLLRREGSKRTLLDILFEKCTEVPLDLTNIGHAFDLINLEYVRHLSYKNQTSTSGSSSYGGKSLMPSSTLGNCVKVIIDQSDLFTNVFSLLVGDETDSSVDMTLKQKSFVLMEYFRSLKEHEIPVQYFLDELLINLMVQMGSWFQLHQCLQYQIFTDSKPLSCLLLSLESVYPPAGQLALDMLNRLGTANPEIVEILLSKNIVLSALKFAETDGGNIQPRRFLESAMSSKHNSLFYSTYKYFERRNLLLRGSKQFASSDNCDKYVRRFAELYPQDCD